jgi:hypothetical protein
VPFETILTRFSRDIGHVLVRRPTWVDMQTAAPEEPVWISTRDSIDRYHTSATVVNREGGFREILEAREAEILRLTSEFLRDEHTGEEYRAFQEAMSRRAYDVLRSVSGPALEGE